MEPCISRVPYHVGRGVCHFGIYAALFGYAGVTKNGTNKEKISEWRGTLESESTTTTLTVHLCPSSSQYQQACSYMSSNKCWCRGSNPIYPNLDRAVHWMSPWVNLIRKSPMYKEGIQSKRGQSNKSLLFLSLHTLCRLQMP